MRFIWVFIHLFISVGILSIPILILGWFDRDEWFVGKITRFWERWVIWSMGIPYEVRGMENLSHEQQYIFMSNHESALDILLGVACLPYNIVFLAKKELFMIPIFGWAMQVAGMIKIDRQNQEKAKQSVYQAVEKLTYSKFSTLLYPEGTRSESGKILPFKKGGFILAIWSKLPVVPITIIGARSVLPKKSLKLHKGNIKIVVDVPIYTADLHEEDKNKLLTQCRNVMIKNQETYTSEYIHPYELYSA